MRTVIENNEHERYIIPKEKREELHTMVSNFFHSKHPTYFEYSEYYNKHYNKLLSNTLKNLPKLSKEKMDLYEKFCTLFYACTKISFIEKEALSDIMYTILLNVHSIPHYTISEEKMKQLSILLENCIQNIRSYSDFKKFISIYSTPEEYYEAICTRLLDSL